MSELEDVTGISESRAENFRDAGYTTVDDIANADPDEVADEVHGVGEATAPDLVEAAQQELVEDTLGEEAVPDEDDEDDSDAAEDVSEESEEDDEEHIPSDSDEPEEIPEEDVPESVSEEDLLAEPEDVDEVPVELHIHTPEYFDYLIHTLVSLKLGLVSSTSRQSAVAADVLDKVRELGGTGGVTVNLTPAETNVLHAALNQTQGRMHGADDTGAFEAMRDLKEQVDQAREEYLF